MSKSVGKQNRGLAENRKRTGGVDASHKNKYFGAGGCQRDGLRRARGERQQLVRTNVILMQQKPVRGTINCA